MQKKEFESHDLVVVICQGLVHKLIANYILTYMYIFGNLVKISHIQQTIVS
jgi:hypothetical protein